MLKFKEFRQQLNEMPYLIDNWSPDELVHKDKNHEVYLEMLRQKGKKEIIKFTDRIILYKIKSTYICLDFDDELVTYYMTYKTNNVKHIGEFVWQSLVWAEPGLPYLKDLPSKIVFEYLIPTFKTVLTDSKQTFAGQRFWQSCIVKAFEKNLNVYYFDFKNKELLKIETYSDWKEFSKQHIDDIWGYSDLHLMRRMVITNKELK